MMIRSLGSTFFNSLGAFFLFLLGMGDIGQTLFYRQGPLGRDIFFDVEPGANLTNIAQTLKAREAIYSDATFRLGAVLTGRAQKMKFGQYKIPAAASMDKILDILMRGGQPLHHQRAVLVIGPTKTEFRLSERNVEAAKYSEILRQRIDAPSNKATTYHHTENDSTPLRVVVVEGVSSWQVVNALRSVDFLRGEIPAIPGEGRLATGAYEAIMGDERAHLIAEMEQRQEDLLLELWENRQPGLPVKTAYEALILASIVEKETHIPAERAMVASVFINRLKKKMRLQSDPTIIYGITQGKGGLGRALSRADILRKTPWNTYRLKGLPPTPIANPGRLAIHATLNPQETEYMYFVADGAGGHMFSKTIKEHNENVRKWRKEGAAGF